MNHHVRSRALDAVVIDLEDRTRQGSGEARILGLRFEDDEGNLRTHFRMGEPVNIIVRADFFEAIENPTFAINFLTDTGTLATSCLSSHYGFEMGVVKGVVEYRMRIESLALYPRTYIVEPYVADSSARTNLDWVRDAASMVVTLGPEFMRGPIVSSKHGISYTRTEWDAKRISGAPAFAPAPLPLPESLKQSSENQCL